MNRARNACCALLITIALGGCDSTSAEEHVANAETRLEQGELSTAVIELKNALQKAPDLAEARLLLAEAHSRLGEYPSALREFERALDLGLDTDRVRAGLLRSKVRLGRYHEVIGELEDQGELPAPFAVILGDAYRQADDLSGAARMYRQAPRRADAQLGLGMVAWRNDDAPGARAHLEQAVELDPESPEAWLQLGEFELSQQQFDAASAAFSEALAHPAGRISGQIGLTRTHLVQGNLESAGDHVAQLLELAPSLPMAHYLDGLVRFEQEDIEGAEAAIRQVQQAVPGHAPSLYLMGAIKYRQGQLAQAEDNLQRFLAQQPRNESAAKLLASLRFEQGNFAQAAEVLEPLRRSTEDPQLLAMYGTAQMRLGRPAQAVEALEAAVALAPDMAPFRNQLALGLLAAGDQNRAEAELGSAIEVDGEQFQSDYLLAMVRLRERDWDGAGAAVEALIAKSPDSPIGYNMRGAIALARGELDDAVTAFEAALERDAAFLPAVQNLARLHQQQDDPRQAIERYKAFIDQQPDHEGALLALAELLMRQDDRDAGIAYLQRAVAADSSHVRSRLALARVRFADENFTEAGRLLDEALAVEPESPDLLLLRAEVYLRSGNLDEARNVAARMQSSAPGYDGNARFHFVLGTLQARLGEHEQARSNLELVLASGNEEAARDAVLGLARLDLADGAEDAAAARLRTWLQEHPDDTPADLLLAQVLMRQDDEQALAHYETLVDTGNPVVLNNLAWLYMERDDPRAVDMAQRAAAAAPDNSDVLDTLGWVLFKNGQVDQAVTHLRRSVQLNPDNPTTQYHLGMALQKADQREEARLALNKALEFDSFPERDDAEQALQSLDR